MHALYIYFMAIHTWGGKCGPGGTRGWIKEAEAADVADGSQGDALVRGEEVVEAEVVRRVARRWREHDGGLSATDMDSG